MAEIIVFGNYKGGAGKTTLTFNTAMFLTSLGCTVAIIDLDFEQASITRYIQNRNKYPAELLTPKQIKLNQNDIFSLKTVIDEYQEYDFIIIDTPGNTNDFNKIAHSLADKVITPINDSFLDLDLIGQVDPRDFKLVYPGIYSAMLFEQKLNKAANKYQELDWLVVRNRLSSLNANNKKNVEYALYKLSKNLGFRIAAGLSDRVIYKELFLLGLSIYDTQTFENKVNNSLSIINAKQEIKKFIESLNIKKIKHLL
jgi:chromosome partitioning protein